MIVNKTPTRRQLWLLPTISGLIFTLVFLLSLYYMPMMMNADGDLGRHLTVGRYILQKQRIPTRDLFSHTMAGEPFIPHSWLSEVAFAFSHQIAGLDGVAWLTALILASAYALLTAGMMRFGVRSMLALIAGLTASVGGALHALTRPHIFTLLFFTLFLLAMESFRSERKWLVLIPLPFVMIFWANSHGAFISGITLAFLYAIGQFLDRKRHIGLLFLGLGSVLLLASWINPAGPTLASHSFAYLQNRFLVDQTFEYNSPNFHFVNTWPFAGLMLLSILLGWRRNHVLSWTTIILLLTWTGFALYSARNIPLYIQISVLFLAQECDDWIDDIFPSIGEFLSRTHQVGRLAWGWMWPIMIVGLLIIAQIFGVKFDFRNAGNTFDPRVFPVKAVDSIKSDLPEGAVFNDFKWGGYMLYHLWPQKRVFIDGQTDFYGESLTREHIQVSEASPGWEDILDKYQVQWILIPPDADVADWLDLSPVWERIYADETAVVWVQR